MPKYAVRGDPERRVYEVYEIATGYSVRTFSYDRAEKKKAKAGEAAEAANFALNQDDSVLARQMPITLHARTAYLHSRGSPWEPNHPNEPGVLALIHHGYVRRIDGTFKGVTTKNSLLEWTDAAHAAFKKDLTSKAIKELSEEERRNYRPTKLRVRIEKR